MSLSTAQPALLVLADGTAYRGWSFGANATVVGEVVFNTGMTGYQEVLTDPSYCGQIVTFTYPELGNTGVNLEDEESSRPQIQGAIARNVCSRPSNWRCSQSLQDYPTQYAIPGNSGTHTPATPAPPHPRPPPPHPLPPPQQPALPAISARLPQTVRYPGNLWHRHPGPH